jgi:2-aminoadipate transaminase
MTTARGIDWSGRFARRARQMKPSALRQLLKVTNRPGMISFAGGLPDASLFPLERVESAVQSALRRMGGRALQYSETEGLPELREWIARRHSTDTMPLTAENVLITAGAQQALDLVGRVLLDDGDSVVVENPTYMAALLAWEPLGAKFAPAEADQDGIRLEALPQETMAQAKLVYLVPNFQNPTGATLTEKRRRNLLDALCQTEAVVIEDNPYAALRYEGAPVPSLLELDAQPDEGGRVVQAGTFSKTLMPGLRVGWIIGPRPVVERMGRAKQAMDLHTGTFSQHIALELVNSGYLEEATPKLVATYRQRRDAMLEALAAQFPKGSEWSRPQGGMFVFAALPPEMDAGELLPRAIERNVAFVPGAEFHLDGGGRNTLRLNFTKSTPEEIETGVRRLADAIRTL